MLGDQLLDGLGGGGFRGAGHQRVARALDDGSLDGVVGPGVVGEQHGVWAARWCHGRSSSQKSYGRRGRPGLTPGRVRSAGLSITRDDGRRLVRWSTAAMGAGEGCRWARSGLAGALRVVVGRRRHRPLELGHEMPGHVESLCHSHVMLTIALRVCESSRTRRTAAHPHPAPRPAPEADGPAHHGKAVESQEIRAYVLTRRALPFMVSANPDRAADTYPHKVRLSKTP